MKKSDFLRRVNQAARVYRSTINQGMAGDEGVIRKILVESGFSWMFYGEINLLNPIIQAIVRLEEGHLDLWHIELIELAWEDFSERQKEAFLVGGVGG